MEYILVGLAFIITISAQIYIDSSYRRIKKIASSAGMTGKEVARTILDKNGLDNTDRDLLLTIIDKFNGGPVGIDAISSSIGEEATTIEDVYEPYLLQQGFLKRTNRGRIVTDYGYQALGRNHQDK